MAPDSSVPLLLVQHHHTFFQMFMHWVSFGVHMFMFYCTAYFVYHKYMKPYEEAKRTAKELENTETAEVSSER